MSKVIPSESIEKKIKKKTKEKKNLNVTLIRIPNNHPQQAP